MEQRLLRVALSGRVCIFILAFSDSCVSRTRGVRSREALTFLRLMYYFVKPSRTIATGKYVCSGGRLQGQSNNEVGSNFARSGTPYVFHLLLIIPSP